jgi:hypothetical protein
MSKRLAVRARGLGRTILILLILIAGLVACVDQIPALVQAQEENGPDPGGASVSGRLLDPLGEAIHEAEVMALANGSRILRQPAGCWPHLRKQVRVCRG